MPYPKSKDKKIQKLTNVLIKYVEQEDIEFSFGGEPLAATEVFSFFGGMPLLLIEAKEHYEKLYNNLYTAEELMSGLGRKIKELTSEERALEEEQLKKLPINKRFPIDFYAKEEDTFFGFIPRISQDIPCDFLTIAHFSHYTLEEYLRIYKKNKMLLIDGRIPLDPLYEKMVKKINAKEVKIAPASAMPKSSNEKQK